LFHFWQSLLFHRISTFRFLQTPNFRKYYYDNFLQFSANYFSLGLAKKDNFRGITAKMPIKKDFFSNFEGLAPCP
jgi:hypothetical protein